MGNAEYSRTGFLGGLGVTAMVCLISFGVLHHWGRLWDISTGGWWALGGAAAALIIKMLISDWAAKKFEWHKHGYDMCIMTLGTSLTALAYAFASDDFPRAQSRYLAVLFIVAMIFTFIAAGNSRAIDASEKQNPVPRTTWLRWANIILGVFAISMNLYVLVVKDQGTSKHLSAPSVQKAHVSGASQ